MDVSIVIPVFNEEESIKELHSKLTTVLKNLGREYEIIFVDDGSTDRSFEILSKMHRGDKNVRVIKFRRNFGQTAAISAGIERSKGDVIVTMDADLQNDPSDIPKLLEKIYEGFDVVSGWRQDRKDPRVTKKIPSTISNFLARKLTGLNIHDFGCTLKVYRRAALRNLELHGEMHRYIPALIYWRGFKVTELPVAHHARRYGETKYGSYRLLRGFLDLTGIKLWMNYSTSPIQFFGILGIVQLTIGFLMGLYLSVMRIFFKEPISSRPMLFLSVLLVILGVQFISLGFLGEIVVRTYYSRSDKEIYSIEKTLE